MKKCLLFSAIFYSNFVLAQLHDSFNDSNFTSAPEWAGSAASFHINSAGQLQSLKSDSAGTIYLSTGNSLSTDVSWEFYIQMNFSPSASNYIRIYLISDSPDLNEKPNGYYLQIGENGTNDSYDLYKTNGDQPELLIDGKDGRASAGKVMAWIQVNRAKDGTWSLFSRNSGETSYTLEGEKKDSNPFFNTRSFGIRCTYTKSRSDQFIFDDFKIGTISGVPDTSGHSEPGDFESEKAKPNDILISEVLFNPRGDGADFVEIYNQSEKVISLADLSLATIKKDTLTSIKPLSLIPVRFNPGDYMVLTTNPDNIQREYYTENPKAFLRMASMPAFNNDAGTVILLADSITVDRFDYTEKMHSPLIKNPDGVSLERVSFNRPTNEAGNFRSAAASAGYATPGYKNSQSVEEPGPGNEIFLSSGTFSPDNDGFEDILMINYHFKEPGYIANAAIYNDRGVLIKHLAENMTLGQEGTITWDGLNESLSKPPVGIYIVYIELFDINGHVKRVRKPCVLAAKL